MLIMDQPPDGYVFESILGTGGFNTVWKAKQLATNEYYAIKVIDKKRSEQKIKDQFYREAQILPMLIHVNIERYYALIENANFGYLILEYVEGLNLKQYIQKYGKLKDQDARHYFAQILSAIEYFHKKTGLLHRDVKAENIMINEQTRTVKIIDFGLSGVYTKENPNQFCGSPKYVAPEIYSRQEYGTPAEVWSLGVNLFYMTTGHLPFEEKTLRALSIIVRNHEPQYPTRMSASLKELIQQMLLKTPELRPTIKKIRESPWLRGESIIEPRARDEPRRTLTRTGSGVMSTPVVATDGIIERLLATGRFVQVPRKNTSSEKCTHFSSVSFSSNGSSPPNFSSSAEPEPKTKTRRRKKHSSIPAKLLHPITPATQVNE